MNDFLALRNLWRLSIKRINVEEELWMMGDAEEVSGDSLQQFCILNIIPGLIIEDKIISCFDEWWKKPF